MIDRRTFVAGLPALALHRVAFSQPRAELPRVGLLFAAAPSVVAPRVVALRQGMKALGYIENKHYVLEPRYADGDLARLPILVAELIGLPVQVVVSGGASATRPLLDATKSLPIVMGQENDPVGAGIVPSLARPEGNVTGLATLIPELSAKQLALLAEMLPGLMRVALIGDSGEAGNDPTVAEAITAARRLNLPLQYLDRRKVGEPPQLFAAATQGRAGAVLVLASAYLFARQGEMCDLALQARMPSLFAHWEYVRSGGLATYGVNVLDLFRYAATYVVEILEGARPRDLPIEQPTKLEFVINLRTAKQLNLTIPRSVLLRADEVIQ